jgi:NADPH:quinone reductase-like Zn-dependent oxidoreductase
MAQTMRAMARQGDGFVCVELPRPQPGPGEVRVRVVASAINPADEKVIAGQFAARFIRARTDPLVLGYDVAGTVDAVGDGVSDLSDDDAVWGHLAYASDTKQGAFAQYVVLPAQQLAPKHPDVEHHVAAAAATVGMTALQSLRDEGQLREGGRALVIGAGGGVGSMAVGIAKRLSAHVTGVCSTKDVDRVEALGADAVIDRSKTDPFSVEQRFDVVFDTPAAYSYGACAGLLEPGGTYVTTLPGPSLVLGMLRSAFSSKRCRFLTVASRRPDLQQVGAWIADGLEVSIDSRHPIRDLKQAFAHQAERGRTGKVVVDVADGW